MHVLVRSQRRFLSGSLLTLMLVMAYGGVAAADGTAQPTLTQRILPLNCIFEIVNDGTGTIRYLTPEECGVLVNNPSTPTDSTPPSSSPATEPTTPGSQRQAFLLPSPPSSGSGSNAGAVLTLPWKPIATTTKTVSHTTPGSATTTVKVVGVSLAVLAVLVLMIVIL